MCESGMRRNRLETANADDNAGYDQPHQIAAKVRSGRAGRWRGADTLRSDVVSSCQINAIGNPINKSTTTRRNAQFDNSHAGNTAELI
jgi:hypothetical protein